MHQKAYIVVVDQQDFDGFVSQFFSAFTTQKFGLVEHQITQRMDYYFPGRPDLRSYDESDVATRIRAEHIAVMRVLGKAARDDLIKELSVYTNSKYILLTYTELVHKWDVNGYINCKGHTVCDNDVIKLAQLYRSWLDNVEFHFLTFDYDTQCMIKELHQVHQDIYVDGSCRNNGQDGAHAGIGVYFPGREYLDFKQPLEGKQTNNRSELEAVRQALIVARKNCILNVTIYSDSMNTVKTFNEWCHMWEVNGYRTSGGKHVSNQDIIRNVRRIIQDDFKIVNFKHTPAHRGDPGNTRADALAKEGAALNPLRQSIMFGRQAGGNV